MAARFQRDLQDHGEPPCVLRQFAGEVNAHLGVNGQNPLHLILRRMPGEFLDEMFDNYDRETRAAVLDLYRSAKDLGGRADEVARQLAAADIPALVVWGARDHYLNASFASRQREAFPSAEVHLVPDSGHWPFIDSPDVCRALLVDFLEDHV